MKNWLRVGDIKELHIAKFMRHIKILANQSRVRISLEERVFYYFQLFFPTGSECSCRRSRPPLLIILRFFFSFSAQLPLPLYSKILHSSRSTKTVVSLGLLGD